MAKKKINMDELEKAAASTELQEKPAQAAKSTAVEKKDIIVRGVPVEWYDVLTKNGHKFASYARIAVQEKMKRDGLL